MANIWGNRTHKSKTKLRGIDKYYAEVCTTVTKGYNDPTELLLAQAYGFDQRGDNAFLESDDKRFRLWNTRMVRISDKKVMKEYWCKVELTESEKRSKRERYQRPEYRRETHFKTIKEALEGECVG